MLVRTVRRSWGGEPGGGRAASGGVLASPRAPWCSSKRHGGLLRPALWPLRDLRRTIHMVPWGATR